MSTQATIVRPTIRTGRQAKAARAARLAGRTTKTSLIGCTRQADPLKAQLRGLCDRAARAADRLRECDLDAAGVEEKLGELVRDLSEAAMRVQTVQQALAVRVKLTDAFTDLRVLGVLEDDVDDVRARVQRPMIAETRRRLAAIGR